MNNSIKLSLLSVVLVNSLQAKNQYTLDEIEVTASQGTALNKKDVTDSVIIITKEEIEESRVSTLNEALTKLANLSMTQNGGRGTASSIFVRGMSSKRILVLVNGIRYNNPTAVDSVAEFSQIMLNNVERIEVLKGAQSGVWGSDASGGVINIITSKAKKGTHAMASVEYGSFNSTRSTLYASFTTDKLEVSANTLLFTTDGFSAVEPVKGSSDYGKRYDELGLEKDLYINRSSALNIAYNFSEQDRIDISANLIKSTVYYDSSAYDSGSGAYHPTDSLIPQTTLKNQFYSLAFRHNGSTNDVKVSYSLSIFDNDNIGEFGTYSYTGRVNEFKAEDKIAYMQNSFVRFGASYQQFAQQDIVADTDKDYSAISAFITNYNKLSLLGDTNTIITESARYDSYDAFDNALTAKFGLKQFIKNDLFVSLNIGSGFNAPTLGQLYGPYGANPDLKPEKSLTNEITLGNDKVWITGFYNEITDLIDYSYPLGYVQTSGKTKFKGMELGYEDYFADALGVKALYTYVLTEDADGKSLARRPRNQLNASATYYVSDDFDIGANLEYIGERYNQADNQGAQTGKYTTAGLVANVKASKYVDFYAKIENLTDLYYQNVDGYATAGRSVYVGLSAKY